MYTVKVFDSDYGFVKESEWEIKSHAIAEVLRLEKLGKVSFVDGGI